MAPAIAEPTSSIRAVPVVTVSQLCHREPEGESEAAPVPMPAHLPRRSLSLGLLPLATFPAPYAEEVSPDAPLKAAALAIGATIGGAGGVLVKTIIRSSAVSYGDAWIIGSATGVGVIVLYLLL